MKRIALLLIFLLPITSACGTTGTASTHHSFKVKLYKGYEMPKFLGTPVKIKTHSDIAELLTKPWYDKFEVSANEKAPFKSIVTCNDYFKIKKKPLWTAEPADNGPFMNIVIMCLATRAISKAVPPHISTFKELKFNKNLPGLLPAKMAMFTSSSEEKRILAKKSIKHMSQVYKIIKVKQHSRYDTTYYEDGQKQKLQLVAKGDFNHDGIEDYLISSQESVQGGTYSALRLYLVTRRPGQPDYTLLKEYQY